MTSAVRSSDLERKLLGEVSKDRLWDYVSTIAKFDRMSGSAEEREAMAYIATTLRSWNVEVHEYEHDGFVSRPVSARLVVLAPEQASIECITHSFAASGTVTGEVVYVGQGGDADYAGKDVAGKIVLVEGLASPGKVVAAEQHGAAGAICINDENLHQMIVTPIWGTPTPETIGLRPTIVVVSVRLAGGDQLKQLLQREPVRVRLETEVWTGWAKLPVVTGDIPGATDPAHFVMFTGHVDSWFYGAMDNAAANATMLEVTRLLAEHRDQLRRGLRVVFMSGHSHGRYAGSTWYADTFWEDLYDHCVANVNVDSAGARGATLYEEILAMAETANLARDVIADLTGQKADVSRIGRAGDQSFWGIGIPSMFMSLSRVPLEEAPESLRAMSALTGRKKSGQAWFWHTEHDTIDKIDRDVLALDTKIYVATIVRLCNSPILPFDYAATVDELLRELKGFQERAGNAVDLKPVIARAQGLKQDIDTLNQRIAAGVPEDEQARVNQTLMDLGRILEPIAFTERGPFEHDLALHAPVLPLLTGVNRLAQLSPASDDYRFLRTQLLRRRNRVAFAFRRAQQVVDGTLAALGTGAAGA